MPSIERDGQRVEFDVHEPRKPSGGAPPEGRTLVCAHNLLMDRTIFAPCIDALSRLGRVVAVDLRGHGASRGSRRAFSVRDLAGDLQAVLDAVEAPRAVLVGVSLGAAASAELALSAPSRVEKLVLLGATGRPSRLEDMFGSGALGAIAGLFGSSAALARAAIPSLLGPAFRAKSPGVVAYRVKRIAALRGEDVAHASHAWTSRPRLLDRASSIAVPTCLLVGEDDAPCPPAHARELAYAIPGAEVHVLAGSGHTLPLEQPEAVCEAIARFVTTSRG